MILKKSDPISITKTAELLVHGEIVIIPTDTVYGFSGIVPNTEEAIRSIKGREEKKPFIQLIAHPEDVFLYTDSIIPKQVLDLWPGSLTIVVKDKNKKTTTAYRCPRDAWLRAVIDRCNNPIYSTSVNRAGQPIVDTIHLITKEYSHIVSLIIDGDDERRKSLPSTIVDVTNHPLKILRQGAVIID